MPAARLGAARLSTARHGTAWQAPGASRVTFSFPAWGVAPGRKRKGKGKKKTKTTMEALQHPRHLPKMAVPRGAGAAPVPVGARVRC